jgi:hypothetical protein
MTEGEQRIIENLMTSNATEMEDLPDWFLELMEQRDGENPSRELITAASLLLVRRERPGIEFGAALRILAGYFSDPRRFEELAAKIQAFRLSCRFERLRRAGLYEEVVMADPFDLTPARAEGTTGNRIWGRPPYRTNVLGRVRYIKIIIPR